MSDHNNVVLFHFTAFSNLESILRCGCLKCVHMLIKEKIKPTNLAYTHIQKRREDKFIPGTLLCLHDFVPFMFAPRSPMLYAIIGGKVAEAEETNQDNLVYFVTDVDTVQDMEFWFSDYHPVLADVNFYNDLADLNKIDWFVINQDKSEGMIGGFCKYWTPNKIENGVRVPCDRYARRQETRQAEFLIRDVVPLNKILKICVRTETMEQKVLQLLLKYDKINDIKVEIKPDWYF